MIADFERNNPSINRTSLLPRNLEREDYVASISFSAIPIDGKLIHTRKNIYIYIFYTR